MLPNPHVSFTAEFPEDQEFPHPPGCGIARYLEQELKATGLPAGPFDNWRDSGWSIDCPINGKPVYLFFALTADEDRPWLLCCTSHLGFLARVVKRERHDEEKRRLALAVHGALLADERFSDIRWYTGPRFSFSPDDAWAREPI